MQLDPNFRGTTNSGPDEFDSYWICIDLSHLVFKGDRVEVIKIFCEACLARILGGYPVL